MSLSTRSIVLPVTLFLAGVSIIPISVAATEAERHLIYRWTDESGQIHFGDSQIMRQQNHDGEALSLRINIIKSIPANDSLDQKPMNVEKKIRWKRKPVPVSAETKKLELCHKAETQLREVRAIMRNGYKPSQFNRLHRRELQAIKKRSEYCQD